MILKSMPEIDAALCRESWEWLREAWAPLALAVESEAARGTSPEDIYLHILRSVGHQRQALALRCRQAAEHLAAQ